MVISKVVVRSKVEPIGVLMDDDWTVTISEWPWSMDFNRWRNSCVLCMMLQIDKDVKSEKLNISPRAESLKPASALV